MQPTSLYPRNFDSSRAGVLGSALIILASIYNYRKLSRLQLVTAAIGAILCAFIGLYRFTTEKSPKEIFQRLKETLGIDDWELIEDPKKEIQRCGLKIESLSIKQLALIENALTFGKPLGLDIFASSLEKATKNYPTGATFYRHLKCELYQALNGIITVAGGNAARAPNATGDMASRALTAGGGIPIPGVSTVISTVGTGISYITNTSEIEHYKKVAPLFTDPLDLAFFVRHIATYFTKRCADSLPYLEIKETKTLAEKVATCTLEHMVYKRTQSSHNSAQLLNLAKEAKEIEEGINWDAHLNQKFQVKEDLRSFKEGISFKEALKVNSES